MAYLVYGEHATPDPELGGKARSLAVLAGSPVLIPPWVALTPAAFEASLSDRQKKALAEAPDGADIEAVLADLGPCAEVRRELEEALRRLGPRGEPVAVRSSALEEDGALQSFAGQLESRLFVAHADVPCAVVEVWRSGFGARVLSYRRQHGLRLRPDAPAVIVQRMVEADVSGVAMSADPVTGRRSVTVVAAVRGVGAALVGGACDADTWRVGPDGDILERCVTGSAPVLGDDQVRAAAELARQAENRFGRPQDVEWAIEDGRLYLLQARPMTGLARLADPDGAPAVFDNSNIAESYSGVTTPLTFSFARRAYEEVYREFCRLLGVPEATLALHHDVFGRMLGLVRGRVYYNLLSWYRVLAMLPGFRVNRRFMEQMMGVKESLPESVCRELAHATRGDRLRDAARLVLSLERLALSHVFLGRRVRRFRQRLDDALLSTPRDLGRLRADELVAHYRDLERRLLRRWDAPLLNDFFAMIFYGLLRRCTTSWCGDADGALQNDLLCGDGGMISAAPAARLGAMARLAAESPELVAALCAAPLEQALERLRHHPALDAQYRAYLNEFGDRCVGELKLESATLSDDPLMLLRSIGRLATAIGSDTTTEHTRTNVRRSAEQRVRAALGRHPVRRIVFRWVLANARARVRDRENLRLERTRVFGLARRIFVELGRRLSAVDALDDPRDVFYLEADEAIGFVEGTVSCPDLRALAAVRRAEWERYRTLPPPADRFETRGMVHRGNAFKRDAAVTEPEGDERRGIGCCPGSVRGRARVVTEPRTARLEVGDILVAEQTDPGWIMLFPFAAGLVVERGSLLSHSAIVARELGIPTVVSLGGATTWLKDGDRVELDGHRGVVRRLAPGTPEVHDAQRDR